MLIIRTPFNKLSPVIKRRNGSARAATKVEVGIAEMRVVQYRFFKIFSHAGTRDVAREKARK